MLRDCGSIARSLGSRMRCGQLSMMAGAIDDPAMSARLCVAKTTETFFLRRTLSHSRIRAANSGWSRNIQASSRMRSEEHTSELQSLMRISYAVFCLKKKNQTHSHLQ